MTILFMHNYIKVFKYLVNHIILFNKIYMKMKFYKSYNVGQK